MFDREHPRLAQRVTEWGSGNVGYDQDGADRPVVVVLSKGEVAVEGAQVCPFGAVVLSLEHGAASLSV